MMLTLHFVRKRIEKNDEMQVAIAVAFLAPSALAMLAWIMRCGAGLWALPTPGRA